MKHVCPSQFMQVSDKKHVLDKYNGEKPSVKPSLFIKG